MPVKLDARLNAIAMLCRPVEGGTFADIGCDHGKLACHLAGLSAKKVIATDISLPSLAKAAALADKFGATDRVETRAGDGLDILSPEEAETVEVDGTAYKIYPATKGGEPIGAAVEASANGFGGALTVLVGFDTEGNIIDYSLLSHAETPGLGSKAADWFKKGAKGDIIGKNPGEKPLSVSKDGGEIDAITASTITSRAFLQTVNAAYAAYMNEQVDGTSGASPQH